ncbi:MAG: ribosome silencing factor [Acidimicrobiia bacterium]
MAAAVAIADKKGIDVALLDVSSLLVITDVFVIATGTSRRHVLSLADDVEDALRPFAHKPLRREGTQDAKWLLLDFGDIVIHLFDAETRAYYDLERLWADADRISAVAAEAGR